MVAIIVNSLVILHVIFVLMENVIYVKVDMKYIIMTVGLFVKEMHQHYCNNALKNIETVLIVNMNALLTVQNVILENVYYVMKIMDGTVKLMEHAILFVGMEQ